jgi:uncharacterized membrane protein
LYIAITLVIVSGLIHSIWNLFTKRSVNKVVFLWFCQSMAIVIFLPLSLYEIVHSKIDFIPLTGWLLILASMILHGLYVLLLAYTYTVSDLSQAYPIMRGISPLLVPIIGVFLLKEHLPWIGWLGITLIVSGIFLVNGFKARKLVALNKATLAAISVGIMIASYTIIDKLTLKYLPPITLNEATNIGNLLALSWIAFRSGGLQAEWKMNWKTIMLGGILAPGGYILFLMALAIMPVSQLAPMREIGTVFGTIFGVFLLKEKKGKSRIFASILITLGIIILAN